MQWDARIQPDWVVPPPSHWLRVVYFGSLDRANHTEARLASRNWHLGLTGHPGVPVFGWHVRVFFALTGLTGWSGWCAPREF